MPSRTRLDRRETSAAAQLAQRDFGEELHAQLRKAPWLLASIGIHGLVALVVLMLPATARPPAAAQILSAAAPADPPPQIPPEENELDEAETEVEVDRPDIVPEVIDAPQDEVVSENPGSGEDTEDPAGDPFAQTISGIESTGPNRVIGIGPGVGGPWGLRGNGGGTGGGGDGGRPHTKVVDAALDWLGRHQSPDGRWDCDGFHAQCRSNRCSGPGESTHDPGVTGLALLCFLGRGETHQSGEPRHREIVKDGLRYLRSIQDTEGCFGPRTSGQFQYDHAIASLAMVEAYGLTQSVLLRDSAQRSLDFIHQSRNPYLAWRYGIRDGDNDTSVTGWMVMALKSGKMADLTVENAALTEPVDWIERMTEPEFGRVGYQSRGGPSARTTAMKARFPSSESEALTSVGVLCRIFAGEDPQKSVPVRKGLDLLGRKLPRWDADAGTIDMYYWYYGTLAAFQAGGEDWRRWNVAMKPAIVDHQRGEKDRCEYGSWDPEDPWAPEGGRVYSTALMTLCLEVYYRYPRVFGTSSER